MPPAARSCASTSPAFSVTLKDDRSPLTEADLAAQRMIDAGLVQPDTATSPMLGEESAPEVFAQRRAWSTLWLVDPLDGTREFVKRNGEFYVNIALIEDGEPVLGVVSCAGARGACMPRRAAVARSGATPTASARPIHVQRRPAQPLRVLGSRSHGDAVLDRHARGARPARAHQRRQRAEIRPAGRGRRRPVRAARPDLRVGHGGRPSRGAGGGRLRASTPTGGRCATTCASTSSIRHSSPMPIAPGTGWRCCAGCDGRCHGASRRSAHPQHCSDGGSRRRRWSHWPRSAGSGCWR